MNDQLENIFIELNADSILAPLYDEVDDDEIVAAVLYRPDREALPDELSPGNRKILYQFLGDAIEHETSTSEPPIPAPSTSQLLPRPEPFLAIIEPKAAPKKENHNKTSPSIQSSTSMTRPVPSLQKSHDQFESAAEGKNANSRRNWADCAKQEDELLENFTTVGASKKEAT
ncbi:hypothetical protein LAZ67_19001777 [Cordylochernes scorpioides]|uniref:Uncharacterized protein n=1 Tax=Cordylochernes scorpioides TaxID=51811 RepID=A0ABY6LHZ9_9ARAC|nr:hypothetical protein LAZ67_19001777 [Cordylochernes scorpioides]